MVYEYYSKASTREPMFFQVTPQKTCCLWPNSPDCTQYKDKGSYCCGKGYHGRPVQFRYTPDADRWKCCNK